MSIDTKKGKRRLSFRRITAMILLLISFISFAMFAYTSLKAQNEISNFSALAKLVDEPNDEAEGVSTEAMILKKYQELHQQNEDMAGWIKIEGTNINYPVMLTPNNEEYYLHRDFERKEARSGTPFIGRNTTMDSSNIIVYGHNMRNKTMFHSILQYDNEDFWKKNPLFRFDTIDSLREYEVIGAFYSKAYFEEETGVFRYYEYGGDLSEEQYNDYIEQVYRSSLYDTGIKAEVGDQLVTLSTCSYHITDGRFVVVAKKK